jgi:hypothetical protein
MLGPASRSPQLATVGIAMFKGQFPRRVSGGKFSISEIVSGDWFAYYGDLVAYPLVV